jgi:hypothetical protein
LEASRRRSRGIALDPAAGHISLSEYPKVPNRRTHQVLVEAYSAGRSTATKLPSCLVTEWTDASAQ